MRRVISNVEIATQITPPPAAMLPFPFPGWHSPLWQELLRVRGEQQSLVPRAQERSQRSQEGFPSSSLQGEQWTWEDQGGGSKESIFRPGCLSKNRLK